MADASVDIVHLSCRGQTHTSIGAVDQLPSGARHRADLAAAARSLFPASVPA